MRHAAKSAPRARPRSSRLVAYWESVRVPTSCVCVSMMRGNSRFTSYVPRLVKGIGYYEGPLREAIDSSDWNTVSKVYHLSICSCAMHI